MSKLQVAFVACFVLVAAYGRRDDVNFCRRLARCERKVTQSSIFTGAESLVALSDEAAILDTVCGELSEFSDCVERRESKCEDDTVRNEAVAIRDVIEYICSTEGRALMSSLSSSPCAIDQFTQLRFEEIMQGCIQNFMFEVQLETINITLIGGDPADADLCPFADNLDDCLVGGAERLCGADMATFIGDIWDITARDQLAQYGCTEEVVTSKRAALRTGIPLVLQKTALLSKLKK